MTQQTETREETIVSSPNSRQSTQRTRQSGSPVMTGSPQKEYDRKKMLFRTYQIIWYILGVVEAVLAFRIVLKLLGANAHNGFASFIYIISNPFAMPFAGILGVTGISGTVLEWSTLVAMAVYAMVAYGLVALFQLIKPTDQEEVERSVNNQ